MSSWRVLPVDEDDNHCLVAVKLMSFVFVEGFGAFGGLEGMVDDGCIGTLDMVRRVERLDINAEFGTSVIFVNLTGSYESVVLFVESILGDGMAEEMDENYGIDVDGLEDGQMGMMNDDIVKMI